MKKDKKTQIKNDREYLIGLMNPSDEMLAELDKEDDKWEVDFLPNYKSKKKKS